jgi:hypothetical protein
MLTNREAGNANVSAIRIEGIAQRKQQALPPGMHGWAARLRVLQPRVSGRLQPRPGETLETFLARRRLSIGVDRTQRNFDPMRQQVECWRAQQLSAEEAKLTIYRAFIEGDLEVPKHLASRVHELYFNPQHAEFEPRTMWSLSNAFTSAFKELDPIPQFKATAKLGGFLESRFSESF